MKKILIVDDEKIEREGIRYLLEEEEYDLYIDEAVNGKAALTYLKENQVDILFTDVKMPFIDGLELTQEALKLYPDIKCIIFSGYSEFEFAKTAIKLGVRNYILKPVDVDEFHKTIKEVIEAIDEENHKKEQIEKSSSLVKEHILYQMVNGISANMLTEKLNTAIDIEAEFQFERMILIESENDFFEYADETFANRLEQYFDLSFVYLNLNMQQSVLFFKIGTRVDYYVLAERMHVFISDTYKEQCYFAVSEDITDVHAISEAYEQMERLMEDKFYHPDQYVFVTDFESDKELKNKPQEELLQLIHENIRNKDIKNLKTNFEEICNKFMQQKNFSHIYVKFVFTSIIKELFKSLYITDGMQIEKAVEKIYKSDDIREIISIVSDYISKLEFSTENEDVRKEIQTVQNYIYNNYQKDISIDTLADLVYWAPSYLSVVFKNETGSNLSKFIKAYRMNKAKELLRDTQMKVSMVCDTVGYTNVSYFCKNFKTYYGVSPEQFRKTGKVYEEKDHTYIP